MQPIDIFYSNLYLASRLINEAVEMPLNAFKRAEPTGDPKLDAFLSTFWDTVNTDPDYATTLIEQSAALKEHYPAFALMEHELGLFLYFDANVFHYDLKNICVLYALLRLVQSGGELNEAARQFTQHHTVATAKEAGLSRDAYHLLYDTDPALAPEPPDDLSAVAEPASVRELFPVVEVQAHPLPDELAAKVRESALQMGTELTPEIIGDEVAWYRQLLASLRS